MNKSKMAEENSIRCLKGLKVSRILKINKVIGKHLLYENNCKAVSHLACGMSILGFVWYRKPLQRFSLWYSLGRQLDSECVEHAL